ncbi:MAG: diaminopimelate decarboxylase [Synergistaceae bacterium]|jgi:diaminopimelate decarboxylase|nr:diaminopimelate decarboxylase [Synergistaceae bacterium]
MGNFIFHGCDTTELAREFGTPLYVVSEDEITDRIRTVKSCFDEKYERCRTHFASKAFLTRDMLRILMDEGLGLDVVSGGELYLARRMNFPVERIAFHGNSKTVREISEGLEYGVGKFVCDSLGEISLIDEMARAHDVRANILIRVNPGVEGNTHRHMLTSGGRTKFGLSPEAVKNAMPACMKMANVSISGFHFHVGSQLMDASAHLAAVDVLLELIREARSEVGFEAWILDMGGGFGVPYTASDRPIPIEGFIGAMVKRAEEFCALNGIKRPDLIIEPGRYIVGPSGITLYTVCSVKEVPGVTLYAGVDGGYPDNPRPALYEAVYDAVVANKYGEPADRKVTIAGKCCESGDIVIRDIALPPVERGDVIAVLCTGAYNYSMANNYNKTPIPAIVAIKDGCPRISVRRQTYAELYACDPPPDSKAPSVQAV